MKELSKFSWLVFLGALLISGCEEDSEKINEDGCKIEYPEIVYLDESHENQIITPTFTPEGLSGWFRSPSENYDCLELDPKTGAIDVDESLSGLKYAIEYISLEKDTCKSFVTISGIGYSESIFSSDFIAEPHYNANPSLVPPDGNFDVEDTDHGYTARELGLAIDVKTGVIDLAETAMNIKEGSTSGNGLNREFRVYYRLDDQSNFALNFIDLNVFIFNSINVIPDYLLESIEEFESRPINGRTTARPRSKVIIIITK